MDDQCRNYARVEKALQYIATHVQEQPSLAQIAAVAGVSEHHFQRLFRRWAGVSPKQFLQHLTLSHARQCLRADLSVMESAYESGLAAPARLGELFIRLQAVTPGEFKRRGRGLEISYGFHATPFGECLIACTARGITTVAFVTEAGRDSAVTEMQSRLPAATYTFAPAATQDYCERLFESLTAVEPMASAKPVDLLVAGTPFQFKVWEALLRLPVGARVSYGQLAAGINLPRAARAVGTAVGSNPIAVLIPCHRVIRSDGMLGDYHWGPGRKAALQGWESTRAAAAEALN